MKETKLPCKSCITLATCIASNDPMILLNGTSLLAHVRDLCHKCSIVENFIFDEQSIGSYNRYKSIVDFFRERIKG